jgi:catechol 2,3-dioxygenase-like lactoylglutathione lyase family enzyme
MSIQLNHTIVAASDAETSARWVAEILGLPEPESLPPFWQVTTANGVGLDFATVPAGEPVVPQHYAFLISEDEFDSVYGQIQDRRMDHWADPRQARPQQINRHDGGRGVYFLSNDGHYLEVITRPYGSGSQ